MREYRTQGSVRGLLGNWQSYLDACPFIKICNQKHNIMYLKFICEISQFNAKSSSMSVALIR